MNSSQLIASLESLRRRAKLLSVVYGLALLVLGLGGLIVLGALSDYLLRLPGVPRLIGLMLTVCIVGYVGWRFIYRPAAARLTLHDVAGRVEETFPQFDDRLRSSVQFLNEREALAADPLRRRTVEQAGDIARGLDLDDVLITRPAYLTAAAAMGSVLALTAVAFLLGPIAGVIAGRLFAPLDESYQWPKRYQIAPLTLEDRVPAGRQVPVTVRLARGDPTKVEPIVYYQLENGPVRQLLMARQTDGTFAAAVDARLSGEQAQGALKVWVEAGDDATAPRTIAVVPRLVLTGAEATIMPPSYVPGGRQIKADLTEASVVTSAGSSVTLRLSFNKPLAGGAEAIRLTPAGDAAVPQLAWRRDSDRTAVATFAAAETLRFNVEAQDVDGFAGDVPQTFEVIVRPDQTPGVQIENPRRNESRTPVAVVPLVAVADDDYGFRDVSLVVRKLVAPGADGAAAGNAFEKTIPLFADGVAADGVRMEPAGGEVADRVRLRLSTDWDLSKLAEVPLKAGDVLEYFVRAQDNYEIDGQYHDPVESGRLRITIISQEELNQRVVAELRNVKDQVAAVKGAQDRNARETAELAEQAQGKPQLDEPDRAAAGRLARQESAVAATTKRLSDRTAEIEQTLRENRSTAEDLQKLTRDVTESLAETAERPMKSAASQLEQAGNASAQPETANRALAESQQNQQEASERLREAMEQMEQIGSLRATVDEVAGLLQRQKELGERAAELNKRNVGKTAEQMTPQDRDEATRLADEQEQLAQRTQEALEKMDKLAEEMKESDPASSESLQKAAQTGRQQQVPQQQRQAAQSQRQNQQQQSQQARQQAEIGLEMVLSELKEAERRKLQELQKKLAELQEQIQRLVRRQAGHNLDNRALSGEDPAGEPLRELRAMAGIEGDDPVKPALPRLSAGQEQTERNTRDLSRVGENLPEGGNIAALLTRAGARMERAAVFLRQSKLPDAYEPPQVEALAALVQALNAVDAQRREVEEELANQQKETIRAELQAIRDEQAKGVNDPTLEIQKAKDENRFRVRSPEQIRQNQLPGVQAGLAGRVEALTEDLANVGGVAFVYANKEIKTAMDGVQGRLADGQTHRPTQIEQARIVDGLDAMIDSLKVTPRDKRFDQQQQAGGGGGQGQPGGPSLPPEAELQLIKRLQQGVNRATKELAELKQAGAAADDAEERPVDDRVADTGGRQGELRDVLDGMLQKYSQGKIRFGPEPDPNDALPEEAGEGEVEDRELVDDLLGQNAGAGGEAGNAARVGDRMARSRQRLALNKDPGKATQTIQERIVADLDALIQQAQQQQQAQNSQQQPQQQRRPQDGQQQDQQAQNQGENQPGQPQPQGNQPAQQSTDRSPGGAVDASAQLREELAEWGKLTPRQRQAILDTKDEQVLDSYRKMIEEYYKSLNQRRSQEQP